MSSPAAWPETAPGDATPNPWGPPPEKETVWLPRSGRADQARVPRDGTVVDGVSDGEPDPGTVYDPTPGVSDRTILEPTVDSDPSATPRRSSGWAKSAPSPVVAPESDRFAAPPPEPEPVDDTRRRMRLPLLLAAIATLVIVGLLIALFVTRPRSDLALNQAPASAVAKKGRPDEVVKGYFDALVAGDASAALSYGAPGAGNRGLLTDEVLTTAQKRMPMTDVVVNPADDNATSVSVTYKTNGQKVATDVPVIRRDGGWLLDHTTVSVTINGKRSTNVPLLLNGAKTDATVVEVFPGSYELSTGLPFIAYEDRLNFSVTALDQKPVLSQLTTKITKSGVEALQRRGKLSLDACLARRELAPQNCPFAVSSTQQIDESSVVRTLDNDPFGTFNPVLETATSVGAAVMEVRTTVAAKTASGSTIKDPKVNTATMRADLSVDAENKLLITWQI